MLTKKSIAIAIATGSLVLNAFATTAFADTVTVTGNGADSTNAVTSTNNNSTTVTQGNSAVITNNVSSNADTGNNDANKNTGGNVTVNTGDATSNTQVSTSANLNQANANCGCQTGATDVTISGNGAGSTNVAGVTNSTQDSSAIYQTNHAVVSNNIDSSANTGGNDANRNTGAVTGATGGNVTVSTGAAKTIVGVSTMANANLANIGNGAVGTGVGGSAVISGNGADSTNVITLANNNSALIEQGNSAYVHNSVDANASSGNNDANRNTGADVRVDTGSAMSTVGVDNMVNFNSASLDCGCFTDGNLLKLAGNGADSYNTISNSNGGSFEVFQGAEGTGNSAVLANKVSGNGSSGGSDANSNTGAVVGFDPTSIMTGNSSSWTGVTNQGNVNVYGSSLPTLPGNLQFTFDWGSLLGMFGV